MCSVNGVKTNQLKPVWLMDPKEVDTELHNDFYRDIFIPGTRTSLARCVLILISTRYLSYESELPHPLNDESSLNKKIKSVG